MVQDTRNITLHSKQLIIDEKKICIEAAINGIGIEATSFDTEYDLFTIHTNDSLIAGASYKLIIPFEGELNTDLKGYYRSEYVDRKSNTTRYKSQSTVKLLETHKSDPVSLSPI